MENRFADTNGQILGVEVSFPEVVNEIKNGNAYFIDTETTGLLSNDKIIEISIYNIDRELIYYSVVNPEIPCSEKAFATHGITADEISKGELIDDCRDEINQLLNGKVIICFNADFDCTMLNQTFGTVVTKRFCVMKWCEKHLDYQRYPRLTSVCERLSIDYKFQHRSKSDTLATIEVFVKLKDLLTSNKSLLRDFAEIDLDKLGRLSHGETLFLSPVSNIFSFDSLVDKYGNNVIGIRSKTLRKMLKKEAVRISCDKTRGTVKLKVESLENGDVGQLFNMGDKQREKLDKLKLKNFVINKYLSLTASVDSDNVVWVSQPASGKYYFPSFLIKPSDFDDLTEIRFYENLNRKDVAFKILRPSRNVKKLIALSLQGYSSIVTVYPPIGDKVNILAQHILDHDEISISSQWTIDGEKDWNGNY